MLEDHVIDPEAAIMTSLADTIDDMDNASKSGEGRQVLYGVGAYEKEGGVAELVDDVCGFASINLSHHKRFAVLANVQLLLVASLRENAARRDMFLNLTVATLHALNLALAETHRVSADLREYIEKIRTANEQEQANGKG